MKHILWIALLILSVCIPEWAQVAPDGTPERAIQDVAISMKPDVILRHLPVSAQDAVKSLSAEDRQAFDAHLGESDNNLKPEVPDDGHAFLVVHLPAGDLDIRVIDSVTTGGEAVLRFEVGNPTVRMPQFEVLVWMRFEEGEWRIREVDPGRAGQHVRLDDPEFVERFRNHEQKQSEASAVSTLYAVNYALRRYADVRPDIGFPDDLAMLVNVPLEETDDVDSPSSTSFLSPEMARKDFEKDGYRFHYELLHGGPQGAYQITARPLDFGRSGRLSYATNESGQIRKTPEDRDATSDDPPLGGEQNVPVVME